MATTDRATAIKYEMAQCRHYSGAGIHESCGAGVNYRQLAGGSDFGWALRLPCTALRMAHAKDVEPVCCEKRQPWTEVEAVERVDAIDAAMKQHMLAFRAAHDDAKVKRFGKGHGGADSLQCPVCQTGRLYYRVSAHNGHMHAKCETEGCVSWME